MSTLIIPAPARPAATPPQHLDIALLTARAGLEPELTERYLTDPVSVLAEFGLAAAEPVYLVGAGQDTLVIEDLDDENTGLAYFCGGPGGGCTQDAPYDVVVPAA
ncbi:hypothetical protein GCM10010260_24670 [Streptomyces filipinensis]|uniref:Uncharacterized protein n=1 Tax=Streptomyces filipinensis TaxID=66887 RepID=A0A918MB22_9ACTN|nr:hypothetical protein [Streptomyces filipinensis]GGU89538.1 hypothetical protein GCM10010260_24670 [Streptomyces filipinensis]